MKMYIKPLTKKQLNHYLAIEDLTKNPNHALGMLYQQIESHVRAMHPNSDIRVYRKNPIVTTIDNYDNLLIGVDNISRSSTYTHYVNERQILQTHTSAQIPGILRNLAQQKGWNDIVILLPGLAYRRDVTDKKHVGQVHMLEMWRLVKSGKTPITKGDLLDVVNGVAATAAPKWHLRIIDSPHPYTKQGIEVNAVQGSKDIEILECGLINDQILANARLDPAEYSGWALGMGLDRLVMTLKDIPDIRYLRSTNPKIALQMHNLQTYHEVSNQPAIQRDMSYSIPARYVEEDINEDIREALGDNNDILESIEVISETRYADLPIIIRKRLGINKDQKNVLVRVTLRHLERTITNKEANELYGIIYSHVNHGAAGYID